MNHTSLEPRNDVRCMISGVSLLDAECGAVLLTQGERIWQPASLPLFGRYLGRGIPEELGEGPGVELLLEGLSAQRKAGGLLIDRTALGISPPPSFQHIEDAFGLLALAELHAPGAIRLAGRRLSFGLFSAHVAANLMVKDPPRLEHVALEAAPNVVFCENADAVRLYAALTTAPLGVRCRFGLSFVGLGSLIDELGQRALPFLPFRPSEDQSPAARQLWLEQALSGAADDEPLLAGLADYVAALDEAEEFDDALA